MIVAAGLDPVPVVIVALAASMCLLAISLSARRAEQRAREDWNPGDDGGRKYKSGRSHAH